MAGTTFGTISQTWANEVGTNHFGIWTYNQARFENVDKQARLQTLGGLHVSFLDKVVEHDEALYIADCGKQLVNLAFGEPGRLTASDWLSEGIKARNALSGVVSEEDQALLDALRNQDSNLRNTIWLIPDVAVSGIQIELFEASQIS